MDFGPLIGPLLIAFLAVISVVSQIFEARKRSELGKERRQRKEEIPEATRRMLYGERGEPDIPTAKPKQGMPAMPPPPVQRREMAEPPTASPLRPSQRREVPQQERRAVAPAKKVRTESVRRVESPVRRQPATAPPRQKGPREFLPPEAKKRVQETLQEIWRQAQQAAQGEIELEPPRPKRESPPQPKLRPVPKPPQPVAQQEEEEGGFVRRMSRRPTPQIVQRPKRRLIHPLTRGLLDSRSHLRRGILLREILGPPRGLE